MAQVTPTVLGYLYVEPFGGLGDALPGSIAFAIGNALHLIEAGYSVSHVTCVD